AAHALAPGELDVGRLAHGVEGLGRADEALRLDEPDCALVNATGRHGCPSPSKGRRTYRTCRVAARRAWAGTHSMPRRRRISALAPGPARARVCRGSSGSREAASTRIGSRGAP